MKRLTPFVLLATLALSGCASSSATRSDSAAAGATRLEQQSQEPRPNSVWANDPYFMVMAPPI